MRDVLRRALALMLIALVALSGLCAHAATGSGSGSFVGAQAEADALERGDRGEDVEELQARLMELGYLSGKLDGIFGAQTEDALCAFQAEAGLEESGVADAETREALFDRDAPQAPREERESGGSGEMVWIPRTGKRYHRDKDCSGMKNPSYVSIEEAVRRGFTPCKKCYN